MFSTTELPSSESTTTPDPTGDAEELIRAINQRDRELWVACTYEPNSCNPELVFAETRSGSPLEAMVREITSWQLDGIVARRPAEIEDNDFVRTESVVVAEDLLTATATVCIRDGRAAYLSWSEDEQVILEETYGDEFFLSERSYVYEDGGWKVVKYVNVAESMVPEEPVCAPENK